MKLSASINPAKRRVHRKRRVPSSSAPAVALTLVSGSYDHAGGFVLLTFDRPIEIAGLDPTAINVDDGLYTGNLFEGNGIGSSLTGPATLKLVLTVIDSASGSDVTLSATGASGIVAEDDEGTWAGVTGLVLPFP